MVLYYIVSIFLGLIPEIAYFTFFLTYTKNLKEKKLQLGILLGLSYFVFILISKYQPLYYLMFVASIYVILKLLYGDRIQIIDVFIISLSFAYVYILAFIMSYLVNDNFVRYCALYVLDRILLFVPFLFKNSFNKIYKKYYILWNRNDEIKRNIKSITLRVISVILLNIAIVILNIAILNISR